MIRKILGPPGTGKTTKLIKNVKTFVKLGLSVGNAYGSNIGQFECT